MSGWVVRLCCGVMARARHSECSFTPRSPAANRIFFPFLLASLMACLGALPALFCN